MSYGTIGLLAALVLLIISKDVLFQSSLGQPARRAYRMFLFGILAYYLTDMLWGLLDGLGLSALLYADTVIYFVTMALSVLLWSRYVVLYLEESSGFGTSLLRAGNVFFLFQLITIGANFFRPILFRFDETGGYHAGPVRYAALLIQILLFLLTSLYAIRCMGRTGGRARNHYRTIAFFGLAMALLVAIQIVYPLLPLYSVGYMLGTCLLHSFVIEDEKEADRQRLEEALLREKAQQQELGSARRLAYTDPLTGVKSKLAYVEAEAKMDRRIAEAEVSAFATAVFDLNGLKRINDTRGHEVGNEYIVSACRLICKTFQHSPVFRIGGDEFVALLEGQDYENRFTLTETFDALIEENLRAGRVVVAIGTADYRPTQDASYRPVFDRADQQMYRRKQVLKKLEASIASQ